MEVYWEYAFAENFLLDGLLLYLALCVSKSKVRAPRLLLASAVGAGEALLFPILSLPVWCAYLVKILGGVLLCVIALPKARFKAYAVTTAAFFGLTFAFGGLLTAAYSFFGVEYEEGNGYLVEQAPVALVFALAGIFAVLCLIGFKRLYRFVRMERNVVTCKLTENGKTVRWRALCDSGNLLTFRGKGVCVCSAAAVFALFGAHPKAVGRIQMGTVNGTRTVPVFECERLEVGGSPPQRAYLTMGDVPNGSYRLILHTGYLGNESCNKTETLVTENTGK